MFRPLKFRQKFRHFPWLLFEEKISPSAFKIRQIGEISPHLVTLVDAENVDELLPGAIRQLVDVLREHLG